MADFTITTLVRPGREAYITVSEVPDSKVFLSVDLDGSSFHMSIPSDDVRRIATALLDKAAESELNRYGEEIG
jgi:hypothetical protein